VQDTWRQVSHADSSSTRNIDTLSINLTIPLRRGFRPEQSTRLSSRSMHDHHGVCFTEYMHITWLEIVTTRILRIEIPSIGGGNRRYVGFRLSYLNVIIKGLSLMHQMHKMSAPFKRMSSTRKFMSLHVPSFNKLSIDILWTSCPLLDAIVAVLMHRFKLFIEIGTSSQIKDTSTTSPSLFTFQVNINSLPFQV